MRKHNIGVVGGMFALVIGFLLWHHHGQMADPNVLLLDGGDALKNQYTPLYHARFDSSYVWFEGMNYPFGEHVVFTDCQPLVSNGIRFVSRNFVDISAWTPGIVHWLIYLSVLWAAWLLYLILRRFGARPWFAAATAAALALLSPQIWRITGHFALAYSCFVPLIWYLQLRFFEEMKWKWSLLLGLTVFAFGWIHPYFLMLAFLFLGAMGLWHFLLLRRETNTWKYLQLGVQAVLPLLLFKLLLSWTDPVTDRPAHPTGFGEHTASWASVFLPDQPLAEGRAYVGIAVGLCLVALVLWALVALTRRQQPQGLVRRHPLLAVSGFAGLTVLLFAFGFPFSKNPEWWADVFPPLRQFRSMGRFAWAFYYVGGVAAALVVYETWRKHSANMRWLILLPGLFLGGTLTEAWRFQSTIRDALKDIPTVPVQEVLAGERLDITAPAPDHLQALLVLPYFHIGSENLTVTEHPEPAQAMLRSLALGLPMMNVMMSRTSLSQTWQQLRFLSTPTQAPVGDDMLAAMQPGKGLLVVRDGPARRLDAPVFNRKTDPPGYPRAAHWTIANALSRDIPDNFPATWPDSVAPARDTMLTRPAGGFFLRFDFEKAGNADGYRGKGLRGNPQKEIVLWEGKLPVKAGQRLVLSFWVQLKQDGQGITGLGRFENTPDGEPVTYLITGLKDHVVQVERDWALVETDFVVKDPANVLKFSILNARPQVDSIVEDEFLLRDGNTDFYEWRDGQAIVNNRSYREVRFQLPGTNSISAPE